MKIQLVTPPVIEPVTKAELLLHLRHESDDITSALVITESLGAGIYPVTEGYSHIGASAPALDKTAIVILNVGVPPGIDGIDGKLDAKIQESNDASEWSDWPSGAFEQITGANYTVTQEKEYTGAMAYVRVVAKVTVAPVAFGRVADIITISHETIEDSWLADAIQAAREHVEDITSRQLLTQTWEYYLDRFPDKRHIVLPFGNLQAVESIICKDSGGVETTLTEDEDYIVEANGEGCGRVVLAHGKSWPSFTPYPSNPITIRFICGWTGANLIPKKIKQAVLMLAADLYANRGEAVIGQSVTEDKVARRLLMSSRLWEEF